MSKKSKILITGAGGLVGHAMCEFYGDKAVGAYSKHYDLRCPFEAHKMLMKYKPDTVIHLAGKVGGVQYNTRNVADFFYENIMINTNVLHACMINDVKNVISFLSSCIYPDKEDLDKIYLGYPKITEKMLHLGRPHESNYGYAYAKRMLEVMSRSYNQQYGCNFKCVIPTNLYGPHDNFNVDTCHFIPAAIYKIYDAHLLNKPSVKFWGDGSALRQFTYVEDIPHVIDFLGYSKFDDPVNIGLEDEYSIKEVVDIIAQYIGYGGQIKWDKSSPFVGQSSKKISMDKLTSIGYKQTYFTRLRVGLEKTIEWYKSQTDVEDIKTIGKVQRWLNLG